jgi:hypothetical protein
MEEGVAWPEGREDWSAGSLKFETTGSGRIGVRFSAADGAAATSSSPE